MTTEFTQIKYGERDLGIFLLESIVDGLYKDRLNIVREYAQNETDTGTADEIRIDVKGRSLVISGNGPGMTYDEMLAAKRIGFPTKDPLKGPEAGFRHIGLWSGVSACKTLQITSKKEKADYSTTLRIDAAGLREEFDQRSQKSLTEALTEHVGIRKVDVPSREVWKHGTVVLLQDVREDHPELLDPLKLRKYLQNTAPVDFDPKFEHYDLVKAFLESNVSTYKTFKILFNGKQVHRPPFPKPNHLDSPEPFTCSIAGTKNPRAFAWVCHNKETGELDEEGGSGLVFKWKGWTVGDQNTIQKLFVTEPNRVKWMVGEIHVLDLGLIRPNTEKDNFEPSSATQALEEWLQTTVWNQLRQRVHQTSATSRAMDRVKEAGTVTAAVPNFDQEELWNNNIFELEDLTRKLEGDFKNSKVLPGVKEKIERAVKRLRAHLKKIRKAHDDWKKTASKARSEGKPAEEKREKKEERADDKPESEETTKDAFSTVKPEMDRIALKAKLKPDAIKILEACLRVLTRQLKMSVEDVHDFLDTLDLELSAGGTQ